ncbi:MAG: hypothetical protein ACXVC7_15170, partial [Bacteroidia bacterium]
MRLLIIIFVFIFHDLYLPAQNNSSLTAEADDFFSVGKYGQAFSIYINLIKTDPLNANLNYKIGACYLQSRSLKTNALPYLEKAIEFTPALTHNADPRATDAPPVAYKLLGDAYCIAYKFDYAIAAYEKYKSFLKESNVNDPELISLLNGKIETCKFGKELKELVALPVKIMPDKPGQKVDTSFRHPFTTLSKDKSTLIVTYQIPVNRIAKNNDAMYYEEINIKPDTTKLTAGKPSSYTPTPDTVIYVTTIGASVDGQIVLSYKDEQGDGNLYITRLQNNQWSKPQKVNRSSNAYGWELNESISPDGNTMYFVSSRPGGYGGKDIYKCVKTKDGEWSKANNLGPLINSSHDDEAPFIHPDGKTIFFSSNRNKPKENFENFVASLSDSGIAGIPVVVGYPVDKNADNSFYEVTADKKKIFTPEVIDKKKLKQLQADSLKNKIDKRDNFLITFADQKNTPLTLLKGEAKTQSENKHNIRIIVTDNETGQVEATYFPDVQTGHYSFIVPTGKNNNITYKAPGCLFHSENMTLINGTEYFKKNNTLTLTPIAKEAKITLNNIFFEDGKGAPLKTSETEIANLQEFLNVNPGTTIELSNI